MNEKLRSQEMDQLFRAVLSLQDLEECYRFFEDICTVNELQALAQRLSVAGMLRNQNTYVEITEKTGASTTTIGRVNRTLQYGSDGYQMVFERLEDDSGKKDEHK